MSDPLDELLATQTAGMPNAPTSALDDLLGTSPRIDPRDAPPGAVEAAPPAPDAEPEPPNTPFAAIEYTGDLETDAAAELTEAQAAFRDRARTYKRKRLMVEDSEFWVALCFRTREEKEEFLARWGLTPLGDKYLSGPAVDSILQEREA